MADMDAAGTLNPGHAYLTMTNILLLAILYYASSTIYDVFMGPLAKFPGSTLNAISIVPNIRSMMKGNDCSWITAQHAKYGPIVRIGPRKVSYANGAAAFKEVHGFTKKGLTKDRTFYGKPINGVESIITADDANHSRQRKIISHAFSDRALKEQQPILKHWVTLMKTKLTEQAVAGNKVDMLKFYNCTTFDVMGDLTFGVDLGMLKDAEYSPWVKTIFNGIKAGTVLMAMRQLSFVTRAAIDALFKNNKTIRKKQLEHWNYSKDRVDARLARKDEQRPDLWSTILSRSDADTLVLGEHHQLGSLFMIAGTETTATALSGTTYYLLRNRDKLARLTAEIRESFTSIEDLNVDELARKPYLNAILQEGLRLYPPVPSSLPRLTPKGGAIICGDWIPGGVQVGVHHNSTYRNPDLFRKPNEFHPERWLGDPEFKDDKLNALEPFSVGPRNCVGKNLAWHEMRLILATTLLHFDLELLPESQDWNDQQVYILWEKKPLMCKATLVKS